MRFFRAYFAVLLWMVVIYVGSTDMGSTRNTSRFIGPILRWIKPDVSENTIRAVQITLRKGAHLTLYGILAALLWRAQRLLRGNPTEWRWSEFWLISAFCLFYALSDEFHQTLVSSRQGSPFDVMLDTTGAIAVLLAIRFWSGRTAHAVSPPVPAHS
jgi:VanZ family protein